MKMLEELEHAHRGNTAPRPIPALDHARFIRPLDRKAGGDEAGLVFLRSEKGTHPGQTTDHYLAYHYDASGKGPSAYVFASLLDAHFRNEAVGIRDSVGSFNPGVFLRRLHKRFHRFMTRAGHIPEQNAPFVDENMTGNHLSGVHGVFSVTHGGNFPSNVEFTYAGHGGSRPLLVAPGPSGTRVSLFARLKGIPLLVGNPDDFKSKIYHLDLPVNHSIVFYSDGIPDNIRRENDSRRVMTRIAQAWDGQIATGLIRLIKGHLAKYPHLVHDDVSAMVVRHAPV